jgi:hypothetical protein
MFPSDEPAGRQHAQAASAHDAAAKMHAEAARNHYAEKVDDAVLQSREAMRGSRAAHLLSSTANESSRALRPRERVEAHYAWAEESLAELGGPALLKVIRNAELSCDVAITEVHIFIQQGNGSAARSVRCEIVR